MNIQKYISIGLLAFSPLFANAYADQLSGDLCSKLSGHWHGIYTIKDQNDCQLYNGCTHLVMAEASHVSGNEYRIMLNPAVGTGGDFNIKCENGVITSPVNPGNKISATCNAQGHCYVVYDDPRLTSEMMKD